MLRVLVTKDQILIYLFHQQSKGKGSVRRDEESSRVTYYWISFATILWKNLKFFCVFIHFINRESKNNRWNQVTFHVEFFPTHDMFPIGKSISYIDKQLDHMLVFFFLIQSWMWCLCLPIWIWQVSCIVCRDVLVECAMRGKLVDRFRWSVFWILLQVRALTSTAEQKVLNARWRRSYLSTVGK